MAEYKNPNPCDCFVAACPAPFQQREVRTLGFFDARFAPPTQEKINEALADLRALPWRTANATAISYFQTIGSLIYMSESRARWIVPEGTQTYARYEIVDSYNGGSGTNYEVSNSRTLTWNGPGGESLDSRATGWEPLLIDDWAVEAEGSVNHRGFISRLRYTCYPSEVWT